VSSLTGSLTALGEVATTTEIDIDDSKTSHVDSDASPPTSAGKRRTRPSNDVMVEKEGKQNDDDDSSSPSKRPCAPVFCATCGEQNNATRIHCWRVGCGRVIREAAPDATPAAFSRRALLPTPSPALPAHVLNFGSGGSSSSSSSSSSGSSSSSSSSLTQLSFHQSGNFLPLSTEAKEALREGKFMSTRHYLPQRLTFASLNQTSKVTLEVMEGGGLHARTTQPSRNINTFEDLYEAHWIGIMELLHQFGDNHRIHQYMMLWQTVRHLKEVLKFADAEVIWYYELYRNKHSKVDDCVGQLDPEIERAFSAQTQARMNLLLAKAMPSASAASSSSSSRPNDATHSRRHNVCIQYNNLQCHKLPCPRNFEHICVRCFGPHAADSGDCSLPDPRKQHGFKSRASRGGKGGGGIART
jgi:hypothetical protein